MNEIREKVDVQYAKTIKTTMLHGSDIFAMFSHFCLACPVDGAGGGVNAADPRLPASPQENKKNKKNPPAPACQVIWLREL